MGARMIPAISDPFHHGERYSDVGRSHAGPGGRHAEGHHGGEPQDGPQREAENLGRVDVEEHGDVRAMARPIDVMTTQKLPRSSRPPRSRWTRSMGSGSPRSGSRESAKRGRVERQRGAPVIGPAVPLADQ